MTLVGVSIPEVTDYDEDADLAVAIAHGVGHACYFCAPDWFKPMPRGCTLCSRCGVFIWTGINDPHNERMVLCEECEAIMSSPTAASAATTSSD